MTKESFNKILRFLKANFKYADFLNEPISVDMLFNQCNRFSDHVVEQAAYDIVKDGQYDTDGKRLMFSIETFVRRMEHRNGEEQEAKNRPIDFYCPKCNNVGWLFYEDMERREYAKPCNCKLGRYLAPWNFQTLEK